MNKNLYFLITFIIVFNFGGHSQNVVELSLDSAQHMAVEKNRELQKARYDVDIAEEQYKETRGQGLPQVNGTFNYMTNFNHEAELDFGGGGDATIPDIDPTLFDGGDLEILKLLNSMTSSGPASIKMTDQANAQVQLTQLLFGGQYWVGLKTAKIAKSLAEKSIELVENDVKEQVINSYQLILITEAIIDVVDKSIQNLEAIKTHTENMVNAGVAEQTDVDQLSITISKLMNQKKSMERGINLNYNMLRFQVGMDNDQKIHLAETLESLVERLDISTAVNQGFEVTSNPGFQIVEIQQELQETVVKLDKWAYAPVLTGFYSYTEKILTSGFDLSPNHAAGLTLSVPLFSGGTRKAKVERAKIELDKVSVSMDMLEEQLKIQYNQLKFNLASAIENYNTQKENIEVAKRILETMENKFRQGVISSLELTQVNSNYLQANNDFLSSKLELLQAHVQIKKLFNEL